MGRRGEERYGNKKGWRSLWLLLVASVLGVVILVSALLQLTTNVNAVTPTTTTTTLAMSRRLSGDSHGDDDNGEHHEDEFHSTFVVCIVLGLLFLTIGFEWLKETLQEAVSEQHERIIEKLFGEMTVLGFLSMVTFLVNEAGLFHFLALRMLGDEEDHEELLEVFEVVHMAIFFIMIFFFLQVLVLIRQAMVNEKQWIAWDRENNMDDEDEDAPLTKSTRQKLQQFWSKMRYDNSFVSLLPFFRNTKTEGELDRIYFRALRKQFLLDRDMDEPFDVAPESQRLDEDFNFGRYLGLCLVRFLSKVVNVSSLTLSFFAVGSVLAYGYILLVKEHMIILAWSWLGLEWAVFLFFVFFEQHIRSIRRQLVPPSETGTDSFRTTSHKNADETDINNDFQNMEELPDAADNDDLPSWCRVDLDEYMTTKRPWLTKMLVRGTPNRQETLFWMDRWGTDLYLFMLQTNLIFIGLDCAVQLLFFYPIIYKLLSTPYFVAYVMASAIAILGSCLNKKHLIATLAVVCSVGCHKQFQVIEKVCREEKTENLVRAFLIVYRLRRLTQFSADWVVEGQSILQSKPYTEVLDTFETASVLKIFDGFDKDKDNGISRAEFEELLGIFGGQIPAENLQQVMSTLDGSGDGVVDREEFLQWYSEKSGADEDILIAAPQEIFRLFDDKNNGALTIADFKDKLDALRLGFTVDEQLAIVNELDRHGHGTIGLQEFELLFSKFNPKKLRKSERKSFLRLMFSDCHHCMDFGLMT